MEEKARPSVVDRNIYYQTSRPAPLTEQAYDLARLFRKSNHNFQQAGPGAVPRIEEEVCMSQINLDDVLELIHDEWLMQGRAIRIALEHNESSRALMSLGGEIVCETLERRILNRMESRQRLANEKPCPERPVPRAPEGSRGIGPERVVPSDAAIAPPKGKIGSQRFHRAR